MKMGLPPIGKLTKGLFSDLISGLKPSDVPLPTGEEGNKWRGKLGDTPYPRNVIGGAPTLIEDPIYRLPPFPATYRDMINICLLESTMRACVKTIKFETFRNGLEWVPRWTSRCNACDIEYTKRTVEQGCYYCGGELEAPDPTEYAIADKLFRNCNVAHHRFETVLGQCEDDINMVDDGYLIIQKDYFLDKKGKIYGSKVKSLVHGSPLLIRPITTTEGLPGGYYYTCLKHREVVLNMDQRRFIFMSNENLQNKLPKEDLVLRLESKTCPKCNRYLYDVHYVALRIERGEPERYFVHGEVVHWSKYNSTMIYGMPPAITLWNDALLLLYQRIYQKEYYEKRRAPNMMLVVKTANPASMESQYNKVLERTKRDQHYIPMFYIEPDMSGLETGGFEVVKLTDTLSDMQYVETRKEARDRIIGFYGLNHRFVGDGAEVKAVGSEGFDFVVLSRNVEVTQRIYNEHVIPAVLKQMGVKNWLYVLKPNEERDHIKELQADTLEWTKAQQQASLGLQVQLGPENEVVVTNPTLMPGDDPLGALLGQQGSISDTGGTTTFQPNMPAQGMDGQPTMNKELGDCEQCGSSEVMIWGNGEDASCLSCGWRFKVSLGQGMDGSKPSLQLNAPPTYQNHQRFEDDFIKAPPGPQPAATNTPGKIPKRMPGTAQTPSTHRPAGTQGTYSCPVCGQTFPSQQALGGHMRQKHPGHSAAQDQPEGERGAGAEAVRMTPEMQQAQQAIQVIASFIMGASQKPDPRQAGGTKNGKDSGGQGASKGSV